MNNEEEKKTPSLEEVLGKLDQILDVLGRGESSLEESFNLYKEGMDLLKIGNQKIDKVEKRMLEMDKEGELHEFSEGAQ